MNITIRDVNPKFWRETKIEAVKEGITIGQAINLALENWVAKEKQKETKKTKSFWDLEAYNYQGECAEKLSTQVDDVLYR